MTAKEELAEKSLEGPISPEEARELVAGGEVRALDIRDDEEWDDGRVPGSVHMAEETLVERLHDIPEEAGVLVVCSDGERSAELAAKLRDEGRRATSIEGGMDAWMSDRLPTEPRPDDEFEGPDYSKPPGV
jgi:rhodanese-related sulfurtransferase